MSLYSTAVKKPVTVIMIFIGVVILGIYSYLNLAVNFFPKMDPPYVSVYTFYPGASAEDVEQNITKVIEDRMGTLTNLKKMTSSSKDNVSVISLEFEWGTDLDNATNEVRDAVGMAERLLPDGVDKPTIFRLSTSMVPVMAFSVTADESYNGIYDILDDKLIQPLNRIDGVGSAFMIGAPERAINVNVDPRKLEAYHLSIEQIGSVLAANNINVPSGDLEMGKSDIPLRLEGEFPDSRVIKNIIISNFKGKPVYLKDVVTTIQDSLKDIKSNEMANMHKDVRVMIQKTSDANSVTVANKIKKKVKQIQKILPPDVKINILMDTSTYTVDSIHNLTDTILYALLFVVLVVMFFLGRWRATLIVSLSIPISLIAGFIYMYLSGETINIITLSSLSIAIGMVVDDSIVVLENITKKMERGGFARESAIYGTSEVSLAVVASTLTIIAVFLPLTTLSGSTGVIFKPLGWTVAIAISTSVFVALTLVPMLSSTILKYEEPDKNTFSGKLYYFSQNILTKIDNVYENTLKWAVNHRWTVVGAAVLIFGSSLFLLKFIGKEYMPEMDSGEIGAQVKLAQGVRLSETAKTAHYLDSLFMVKYPELTIVSSSAGVGDENNIAAIFTETGNYIINYTFELKPLENRKRSIFQIGESMRKDIQKLPQVEKFYVDPGNTRMSSSMGMNAGGGSKMEVKVFGNSFDNTNIVAEKISNALKEIKGTKDILISRDKDKAEMQLILDKEKMTSFGLNTAMVGSAVRNCVTGLTATKYKENGKEYDVIVRYDEKYRKSTADILNADIMTPTGKLVKVREFAKVKHYYAPPNIEREDKVRIVKVSSALYGTDLGTVQAALNKKIAKMDIPDGVTIEYGGSVEDMQDSFKSILQLMALIIILVYIVMASQFESLTEPFIIMFSIPFAFTGVFISLYLFHATINIISLIGMVMLVGIVVKNGIVLVDYINLLVARGYSLKDAVVAGGRSRLRPVLMTSLTTILAMLPMIVLTGSGSEMWRPMGVTVFGGLTLSTLVTLVLIPVIYVLFGMGKIKRRNKAIERTKKNLEM